MVRTLWTLSMCLGVGTFVSAGEPAKVDVDISKFYEPGQFQVIQLQIRDEDLQSLQAALPERIFVPAQFQWNDVSFANVAVRFKGNSSSMPEQRHKRGYLIKFNEYDSKCTFGGLHRVALDNGIQFGGLLSEPLITSILREVGIRAARCNYTKLSINGSYVGLYVNVERVDEVFVRNHFEDTGGPLYKVDEGGPGADWRPVSLPAAANDRMRLAFEPQNKAAKSDARDVLELIDRLNRVPTTEFADCLSANLDTDAFLKSMAVLLYAGAFDQLTGWNPHNYCLYRQPRNGCWYYIPFDVDVGFADKAFGQVPVIDGWNAAWPIPGGPPRPVLERIVDDPTLLARYRLIADEILEKQFHPDVLIPRLNALYEVIKPELANDPFPPRRVTNPEDRDYETIVESMREFIRRRYATARAQLDQPGPRPKIVPTRMRPDAGPQPGPPSDDAPSDLRMTACTANSVSLTWTDNVRGEAATIVQRAMGAEGGEFHNHIGRPGDTVTSADDTQVEPGRTYRYRVYAVRPTPHGPQGTGVSNTVVVHVPAR
jgi:spore coat protein H